MKLGLLTSCFGQWVLIHKGDTTGYTTRPGDVMLRPSPPLEDVLPTVAGIGYDTVDICTWIGHSAYPYSLSEPSKRDIPHMVSDLGMSITALAAHGGSRHSFDRYGYLTRDADELRERLRYMKTCIELAAEWKVPVVEDVVGDVPRGMSAEEAWRRVVEAVGQLAEYAVSHHVTVGVELYPGLVHSPDDFLRLLGDVDSDGLGCVMDPSMVSANCPDMRENIRKLGSYIVHTHLKGVREDGKFTTPGDVDDTFDITQFAYLLDQNGYTGSLTVENYPDTYPTPMSPEESARIAFENVTRVLDDLGLR